MKTEENVSTISKSLSYGVFTDICPENKSPKQGTFYSLESTCLA
jgi:hypothetical protein